MQHWFTYPTNIDPVAIHLGPIAIHWYGIAYLAAFVCVYLWLSRPEGRRRLGLTKEQIQDFLFYALIGVLVGGRTFFVINDVISKHDLSFYLSNPLNFVAVWNGGMAFHGGLVGVLVAIVLFVRKHPGLKFNVLGDEVVVMLPLGIALVRLVNFINDELWGDVCNPDHPWCMIPKDTAVWQGYYRHPAQLYEAVLDILTLPVVLLVYRLKPKDGVVAWTWFTIYGITRSVAEIWRQADFTWMGLTGGQLYALPMIVIGLAGIVYCATRPAPRTETAPEAAG
ncbi:MAG: prolipoprotein diacylglyceryl transferase [Candidatus Eremiobacteraeota bacterium]|nr:prolipoprotein diacylglyceryl transferase [Candidatus Eremiobacteraeota bacterium]MBV8435354.1 prolipoprotein diacylglyceryl transferase [Candidatus Eremiobacteraeota bacterium]MBV8655205.1 prolipoprotein diacylglyceryl transferase [Candidatus Eremiobacteraeota bacterium]